MESLHSFLFFSPEETGGEIQWYDLRSYHTKCHDNFFPHLGEPDELPVVPGNLAMV